MSTAVIAEPPASGVSFFRNTITVMAITLVAGFVIQLAMGRSSFSAPLVVHAHAVMFMGWVFITVTQAGLAGAGNFSLHRSLGIIALIGAVGILVLGALVTTNAVQTGRTPFFFLPQHFLIVNPLTAVGFAGLFYAAVAKRNQSDWHIRLQVCAFVMLMGPGFGRILPLPFMTPFAFEIASIAAIVFILAGMARDLMAMGRVHTAWWIGAAVLIGVLTLGRVLAFSPVGEAVYEMVAAGTVMEGVNGLTYPPPPPMP